MRDKILFIWLWQLFGFFLLVRILFLNKLTNKRILVNFAPGIWLISLFDKNQEKRKDCLGDYNRSFIYMLIAQFNYFIWPFILLCVLNVLIMLNIWKRTRKMTRLRSIQPNKGVNETYQASPKFPTRTSRHSSIDKSCHSKIIEEDVSPFTSNPRQIYTEKGNTLSLTPEGNTHITFNDQYSPIVQTKHRNMKQVDSLKSLAKP